MDIRKLRDEVDAIDEQMLELLARRLELAIQINLEKKRLKRPVHDSRREQSILESAAMAARHPLHAGDAADFMRRVIEFSRSAVRRRIAMQNIEPMKIVVIGVGLIGGSLARALKRACPGHELCGVDLPQRLHLPKELGLFDSLHEPDEDKPAWRDAEAVFLCGPPSANVEWLPRLRRLLRDGAIISDTGTVKGRICELAAEIFDPPAPLFVGGHPLAGRELAGFEQGSAGLFDDRPWVLTPPPGTAFRPMRTLQRLIESTGASLQLLTAQEHDRIIPAICHLPQLASVALTLAVGGRDRGLAGPALRDMTRLASSSPALWDELLTDSRERAIDEVQRLRAYLTELEMTLGLDESIEPLFRRASELRVRMLLDSVVDDGETT